VASFASVSASALSRFPCPERNFVIIGPNDSKLGMHASGNDLSISCPEHNFLTIGSNNSMHGMHVSGNDAKCSAQEL